MDYLKDCTVHCSQFTPVESMRDNFPARFVAWFVTFYEEQGSFRNITEDILCKVALCEHRVVLLKEILQVVRILHQKHQAMWPEHTDARWDLIIELFDKKFSDVRSINLGLASLTQFKRVSDERGRNGAHEGDTSNAV